jgi:hypothetical protein
MRYSQKATFQRGSFSTFIGIKFHPNENSFDIEGVGDSICLLLDTSSDNEDLIYCGPVIRDIKDFSDPPILFSSKMEHNEEIFENYSKVTVDYSECKDPLIILSTDAMGYWLLYNIKNNYSLVKDLLKIENEEEFSLFIEEERKNKRIRVDDTTLIIIKIGEE